MALSKEIYDTLPDAVKADYTEHEGEFVPVDSLKVSKLKGSLNELDGKLKEVEKSKAAEIEAARAKALEDARTKGDVAEIEKRYQEQMDDLRKRVKEETRNEVIKELSEKQAETNAASLADKIGLSLAHDKDDAEAIADLIRHRVKIDPETGKEIYYSAQGSALSVDRAGFEAELKKEPRFKRLIKAEASTTGAGKANGSNGNGGASNQKATRAQFAAMNPTEQMTFVKSGGTVTA
jgi:hypothetical protein